MSSGTDKIVSSILSEAQNKADEKIQTSQVEAAKISEDGKKQSEVVKNKILESGKKQSDMRYQQIISEAKMNARRAELGAKEDVIEESFKKAQNDLKEIASSNSNEYIESLVKMIKEAATDIGGGDLTVHLKEEDIDKVKDKLGEIASSLPDQSNLEIGETIDTIGGAIVKTKNEDIEVNNTIELRISRFKKLLRNDVAKILFKN